MSRTAPEGSITRRPSDRSDLLIFEIVDTISEPDIEWMAGQADAAFETHDQVDMLIVMRNFEGVELGAVFDKEAFAVQLRAASHVRRYAVVGAPVWAKAMIDLFSPLTPVEARTFELSDEAAATAWASSG